MQQTLFEEKDLIQNEVKTTVLYTDGGCSHNASSNFSKRKMTAVVSDEQGNMLIDKMQEGGSNNIAELLAIKEALLWCVVNNIKEVEIRTDSMNNFAWFFGYKVGENVNDKNAVLALKAVLRGLPLTRTSAGWPGSAP